MGGHKVVVAGPLTLAELMEAKMMRGEDAPAARRYAAQIASEDAAAAALAPAASKESRLMGGEDDLAFRMRGAERVRAYQRRAMARVSRNPAADFNRIREKLEAKKRDDPAGFRAVQDEFVRFAGVLEKEARGEPVGEDEAHIRFL
mmetsp:Transcript_17238/g.53014  ORF Transcript_17238/g.53014 Transcript_17238/m.53014 type:complete len:146 (-) Transcript_17238:40-477(-)